MQYLQRFCSDIMPFFPKVVLAFGIIVLQGFTNVEGAIELLDVPVAVRNGSGPIQLVCVYNISETDDYGLVVKWYHDNEKIHQWIPPIKPEDFGAFEGLTLYTTDTISRPQSHSIITVTEATMDMSGRYTCTVATFSGEESSETKEMLVYVPEKNLMMWIADFNETHMIVNCMAIGAHPLPDLTIMSDLMIIKNLAFTVNENDADSPRVSLSGVTKIPIEPVDFNCVIQIPGSGYERKQKFVYYPDGKGRNPTINYVNDDNKQSSSPLSRTGNVPEEVVSRSANEEPTTTRRPRPIYREPKSCFDRDGMIILYNSVPPMGCH